MKEWNTCPMLMIGGLQNGCKFFVGERMTWFDILKRFSYEWKGEHDGRPIMLVDVGGEKVLFYVRSGFGGSDVEGVSEENQIKGGQFAPFHGLSYGMVYQTNRK